MKRGCEILKTIIPSTKISICENNVLAVIGDRKLPVLQGGVVVSFEAHVISSQDCSPFGVTLPGRSWSEGYRYGFQIQETDEEIWGGAINYKYRIEDPSLGRFFSVDPVVTSYPELTPYQHCSNSPVFCIELEGFEGIPANLKYDTWMTAQDALYMPQMPMPKVNLQTFSNPKPKIVLEDAIRATQNINTSSGIILGISEYSKYAEVFPGNSTGPGWWLDKTNQYRSLSTPGNQFMGGKIKYAKNSIKTVHNLGNVCNTFGIGLAFVSTGSAMIGNDPNKGGMVAKGFLDITMGLIGFLGPVGFLVSATYSVVNYTNPEIFDFGESKLESSSRVIQSHVERTLDFKAELLMKQMEVQMNLNNSDSKLPAPNSSTNTTRREVNRNTSVEQGF